MRAGRSGERLRATMEVPPVLLVDDSTDRVALHALGPLADVVAGNVVADAVDGDWIATADLSLAAVDLRLPTGPIEAVGRLLRVGSRTGLAAVELSADGRPLAEAVVTFSRLKGRAGRRPVRVVPGELRPVGEGPMLDRPLGDALGLVVEDEMVALPRGPFVDNSIGTIQGGAMVILAGAAAGRLGSVLDLTVRFVSQTSIGPAVARPRVVRRGRGGATSVAVEVVDAGDDDRLVLLASAHVEG